MLSKWACRVGAKREGAKLGGLMVGLLFLSACTVQSGARGINEAVLRAEQKELTQAYAEFRANTLSDIHYELDVHLDKRSQDFSAKVNIEFNRNDKSNSPVTLDFELGTIHSMQVNGRSIQPNFTRWFIRISASDLRQGKNSVMVRYSRPYAKNGSGLHRYDDAKTGNTYLYTQFEPYDANRVFPVFDQPDLKATYGLSVNAPKSWHVISSIQESDIVELVDQRRWTFPKSAKFSPYIFSLHAGPFHMWEDNYRDIPLRLFVRQELKEYVVIDDWFEPTKKSFDFFERYFEFAYPFLKYDQVIVPDFNFGAMENVGAVTFTEKFLSRGEKTESSRMRLANVIAHELAHMWFGNVVTMQWWDDLWLNESFATYMANLALDKATDFEGVWETFYARTKQWAYGEDQQVTTHAIQLPVPSTATVISNIDGITYGKGASVLKQLPQFLGEDVFRQGVVNYIRNNAYQNATLDDFVESLAKAADRDLSEWKEQWLLAPGLNTIQVAFTCKQDSLSTLEVNQFAPKEWPTLRDQKIKMALYNKNDGLMQLSTHLVVSYSGKNTHVAVQSSLPCPDMVYPNAEDWAYVKVRLDKRSLSTLNDGIGLFEESALRLALWQSLWDSVLDASLPVHEYIEFALKNIAEEGNADVIRKVLANIKHARAYVIAMNAAGVIDAEMADRLRVSVENKLIDGFGRAEEKSDIKRLYLDAAIDAVFSELGLNTLRGYLNIDEEVLGLRIDQDLRWKIIKQLNRYTFKNYLALSDEESTRDASDRGRLAMTTAEAIRPVASIKKEWLDVLLLEPEKNKFVMQREVMYALFPYEQLHFVGENSEHVISALETLSMRANDMYLRYFGKLLIPRICTKENKQRLAKAVKNLERKIKPTLFKELRIALQEEQKCLAMADLYKK